jgi:hydrogenase-4 component F
VALALVLLPLGFAALAALLPSARLRPWLVPIAAALHFALVILGQDELRHSRGWLGLDDLGQLFLPLVSGLYLVCAFYVPPYLARHPERKNRVFVTALLAFLGMMSLIILSQHLGLMWIALEANALAVAPLLYFNHNPRSLEATWKYIVISGVGIALALLGSFFLAYAALRAGISSSLLVDELIAHAPQLSVPWLQTAFVFLCIGYGTKVGLAPMHTWKPDAYGEAPGVVGALMAGGLTTCALLALLRFTEICTRAGQGAFAEELLLALGLLSMAVAGVFMARQRDLKRLLAYSSIEHMGVVAVGIGLGHESATGAHLHIVVNALNKGVLFLSAANLHRAFGKKTLDGVSGALGRVPISAALFLASALASLGMPPFGLFVSEMWIVKGALFHGRWGVAAIFLVLLFVAFLGMGRAVLAAVQGRPADEAIRDRETAGTVIPPLLLLGVVLLLGLWMPRELALLLGEAP